MKSSLAASLFCALMMTVTPARPADACGVKLTIKGAAHRKGVARTTNPSDVLLLGTPPRRLSRDLSSAGHRIEVAPNAAAAKRNSYAVVVADNQHADEARKKFPNATILVRSGDVVADMRTVEKQVARKPVAAEPGRAVVAATEPRQPIATGGSTITPRREIVGAAEPKDAETKPAETKPAPPPPSPKVVETKQVEPKQVEPKQVEPKQVETKQVEPKPDVVATKTVEPKPTVTPKSVGQSGHEVYFGLNSANSNKATLTKVVKWLTSSPDVQIIVEGHADPSGNPDSNMALSEKRAEWVRDELVAAGVDTSRIEVKPFGDTKLKYGTTDRRNRRVTIIAK